MFAIVYIWHVKHGVWSLIQSVTAPDVHLTWRQIYSDLLWLSHVQVCDVMSAAAMSRLNGLNESEAAVVVHDASVKTHSASETIIEYAHLWFRNCCSQRSANPLNYSCTSILHSKCSCVILLHAKSHSAEICSCNDVFTYSWKRAIICYNKKSKTLFDTQF